MSVAGVLNEAFVPAARRWPAVRLAKLAELRTSTVDKLTVEGEAPIRLCNYVDVYNNDDIATHLPFMHATASREQVARFRIAVGDTLITKDSETAEDIGVPAYVRESAPDLVCGYHLCIVRPRPREVLPRYLFWALSSRLTAEQWSQAASGVTRVGLRSGSIARVRVPAPPLPEQKAIADYLDRETAQIDALIAKQKRLIETLRERRVVKLSEVLDRGGYGVWKLRRLVDPARPMSYGILQAGEPQSVGVPYIGPSDMPGEGAAPQVHMLRKTTFEIAAQYQRSVLSDRDVVVSIGPAYGKVAVLTSAHAGANLTQDTVRVACRPERLVPEYLVHVLGSLQVKHFWRRHIAGATFVRLNLGTLATTPIPLPDVAEQRRLTAEIDDHTARTDDLIAKADSFIALARERRAALVTAAVTGQIDVRTAA